MADVKYFADLSALTVPVDNKIIASQDDPKGSTGYKTTYSQLRDYVATLCTSAGLLTGCDLTTGTGETVNVPAGTGLFRITDSHNGNIIKLPIPETLGLAIPTNTNQFIGVRYNSGSPEVFVKPTDIWDTHTEFRIGCVTNEDGTIYPLFSPWLIANASGHAIERFFETMPYQRAERVGGLILGEIGTRNVTVSPGELYDLTNEFEILEIDTSISGGFDTYLGLVSEAVGETQWDNDNYNDSGVLTSLTPSKYANLWFYLCANGCLICVYGTAQYNTPAGADAEGTPATIPLRVSCHARILGRIRFQKGASTGVITSAFNTVFSATQAADHGNLVGLGDDDHAQYLLLTGRSGQSIIDDVDITGSLATDNLTLDGNEVGSSAGPLDLTGNSGVVRIGGPTVTALTGVSIIGPTTSLNEAGLQYFTVTDGAFPVLQVLNQGHDSIAHVYDAASIAGNWISSDAGSNFMIQKESDLFRMAKNSGTAVGSPLTWDYFWEANTSGEVTKPLQPYFFAHKSASSPNVTGDGTLYTPICNTVIENIGGNYDNGTGVFTAPVSGTYDFASSIRISGITSSHTSGAHLLITSNNIHYGTYLSPYAAQMIVYHAVWRVPMDQGDTAIGGLQVSGGTKVIQVDGNSSFVFTTFSGGLIC